MASLFIANIAAAIPMSAATKEMVLAYLEAGATAASIIALLGGGGLVVYIVKNAFKNGAKKVILAA